MHKGRTFSGLTAGIAAAVLVMAGLYVWEQRHLTSGVVSPTGLQKPAIAASGASVGSSTEDVPEDVLNRITLALNSISGLNELVVEPAAGGGYQVSATVSLAGSATSEEFQNTVGQFFTSVYSSHCNVQDAEVYAMQNGRIVAGAGLGISVYKQISSTAGVSRFSLVDALKGATNNTEGVDDKWFSTKLATGSQPSGS